jgi:hypothetical protein
VDLSDKCVELHETVQHGQKTVTAHMNKLDLRVDDLTTGHEQICQHQKQQSLHMARLARVAEQDKACLHEAMDKIQDTVAAAAHASDEAGRSALIIIYLCSECARGCKLLV